MICEDRVNVEGEGVNGNREAKNVNNSDLEALAEVGCDYEMVEEVLDLVLG